MSIKVMSAVWEGSKQEGGGLLTLLAIADHADDDGYAYPGVDRLAGRARVTSRHVRRLLRILESSGELVIQPGAGPRGVNLYRVMLPTMTNCQPGTKVRADSDVLSDLTPVSIPHDADVSRSVSDPSENRQSLAAAPRTFARSRSSRKAKVPFPRDFVLTDDLAEHATEYGCDAHREFEHFKAHAVADDVRHVNWPMAFRKWCLKAKEMREERNERALGSNGAARKEPTLEELYPPALVARRSS
jgi:hypothetical protein